MNEQEDFPIEELINYLKLEIECCEKEEENMNTINWSEMNGVLITGNQAKFILKILEEMNKQ